MTDTVGTANTFSPSQGELRLLVRLAAAVAAGSEGEVRLALSACHGQVEAVLVEELILQSYLFCGFPRALNAAREWRKVSGQAAADRDAGAVDAQAWRAAGEDTCRHVYGEYYEQLRSNIRALHPALDEWMILEGYGKVLSRAGMELRVRELCVVAACAASRQERQLHSHLHGAVNAGATRQEVDSVFESVGNMLDPDWLGRCRALWNKVRERRGV